MAYQTPMGDFQHMLVLKYSEEDYDYLNQSYTAHRMACPPGVTRYGVFMAAGGKGSSNQHNDIPAPGGLFFDTFDTGDSPWIDIRVGRGGNGTPAGATVIRPATKGTNSSVVFGGTTINATGGGWPHASVNAQAGRYGYMPIPNGDPLNPSIKILTPGGNTSYAYYGSYTDANPTNNANGVIGRIYGGAGGPPGPRVSTSSFPAGAKGGDGICIIYWNDGVVKAQDSDMYYNSNNTINHVNNVYYNNNGTMQIATEVWYNANGLIKQVFGIGVTSIGNSLKIGTYVSGSRTSYGFEQDIFGEGTIIGDKPMRYHQIQYNSFGSPYYKAMLALSDFSKIPGYITDLLTVVYQAEDNTWKQLVYTWKNGYYESVISGRDEYDWFKNHLGQTISVHYSA